MDNNELVKQEFDKLPLEAKEALGRVDWQDKVKEIAAREKLDEEKTLSLEVETMFILFGILMPEHYLTNLMNEVGIEEDVAKRIEKGVEKEVFEEVEKQYEMITALMPKTAKTAPSDTAAEPVTTASAPTPVKITVTPSNLPVERPEELSAPQVTTNTVPTVAAAPNTSPTVENSAQPLPAMPRARSLDDLNLLNKPTPDSKSATVEPSKSTSYPSGKDPYREPLE